MSAIRTILKAVIPKSLDLPLRYYRMKAIGKLDYELSVLASHIENTERAIDVGAISWACDCGKAICES